MKWGSSRNKKSQPSLTASSTTSTIPSSTTSKPSLISHVLSTSWLSKLKLKNETSKPKGKRIASNECCGRFYGDDSDDGDGYWRLSFGEDSNEGEYKSREESEAKERKKDNDKYGLASAARKHQYASKLKTIEEEVFEEKRSSYRRKLKEKSEKQRKSIYVSKELQQRKPRAKGSKKVRVCSPRTASRIETCKIKALQDMARAKKLAAAAKERKVAQVRTGLDSFAVVKCSFNPQQDFRDSMVEMIVEKNITRLDDLEDLLACYLTLNSDEYHPLIIKVFRQVWFDLNQTCSSYCRM